MASVKDSSTILPPLCTGQEKQISTKQRLGLCTFLEYALEDAPNACQDNTHDAFTVCSMSCAGGEGISRVTILGLFKKFSVSGIPQHRVLCAA